VFDCILFISIILYNGEVSPGRVDVVLRPLSTRPTASHVWQTRGCQCRFRLLMMGGVLPETCWASYKYGIIKFNTLLHLGFSFMKYYCRIFNEQITGRIKSLFIVLCVSVCVFSTTVLSDRFLQNLVLRLSNREQANACFKFRTILSNKMADALRASRSDRIWRSYFVAL
jgi:hypothetical protein